MFDLNLSVDCNGKAAAELKAEESPATSVSSVVNGEGDSSSSNDGACSTRAASPGGDRAAVTFNFGIVGGDRELTLSESGLVTRELFPVSRLGELNLGRQIGDAASLPLGSATTREAAQPPPPQVPQLQARKSRRGPRSRSSQYRGVTFYRRTGRWESHIWDCGKQVYLGGFDTALAAARAYDRAAIKFRGIEADINFNLCDYEEDMKQTKNLSKEEFVHILRRHSTGFSRGSSKYRGVTLHKCGRWEARMGQFLGKKAYDKAALKCNGRDAVTNFESSTYDGDMVPEPHNEVCQNDLDLNLGMSSSSPKESGNSGSFHFHPYDVQNARLLKLHLENSGATKAGNPPLEGLPVASEHPISLPALNHKFVPYYVERAAQERTGLVSSTHEVGKWAWQMHDQAGATPMPAAASSGFSSPATTTALSYPSDSSYKMPLNLSFSSYPSHVSQYYSQTGSSAQRPF